MSTHWFNLILNSLIIRTDQWIKAKFTHAWTFMCTPLICTSFMRNYFICTYFICAYFICTFVAGPKVQSLGAASYRGNKINLFHPTMLRVPRLTRLNPLALLVIGVIKNNIFTPRTNPSQLRQIYPFRKYLRRSVNSMKMGSSWDSIFLECLGYRTWNSENIEPGVPKLRFNIPGIFNWNIFVSSLDNQILEYID